MLKIYTLEEAEQWDKIVRSFKEYDVYWLSGYVKAFMLHGDGEPCLYYYECKTTRGINVIMKRDISKDPRFEGMLPEGEYFDYSTPYGYGGWIIEGDDTEELFNAYEKCMNEQGIICEFVRFHPMIKNHEKAKEYYDEIQLGEVVHMDLGSEDEIWSNITSKNRNVIRKAIKNGVKIYNGRFRDIMYKFMDLYNDTMDKDEADDYYYFDDDFYFSILEDLPNNAQVFWAEKDNRVIAASIILAANGKLNYHLSGSDYEYGTYAPTNLLLYRVALWGSENGYKTFYLGGGVGSGEDSLFKFKRAFYKGNLNRFFIGKKIYDIEKYEKLVNLRESIKNVNYFPKYRG